MWKPRLIDGIALAVLIAVPAQVLALHVPTERFRLNPPPAKAQPLVVRPPVPLRGDEPVPVEPPPTLAETPEPGTLITAVVGGGLALTAGWRRKRKKT